MKFKGNICLVTMNYWLDFVRRIRMCKRIEDFFFDIIIIIINDVDWGMLSECLLGLIWRTSQVTCEISVLKIIIFKNSSSSCCALNPRKWLVLLNVLGACQVYSACVRCVMYVLSVSDALGVSLVCYESVKCVSCVRDAGGYWLRIPELDMFAYSCHTIQKDRCWGLWVMHSSCCYHQA